jgi:hypothetical protein
MVLGFVEMLNTIIALINATHGHPFWEFNLGPETRELNIFATPCVIYATRRIDT